MKITFYWLNNNNFHESESKKGKNNVYQIVKLTVRFQSGNLAINAYVHNAFKKIYYTGTADNFGFAGIRLKPHQREVGLK